MYIHSAPAARSAADQLCPPSYPLCDPSLSAGPALAGIDDNEGDSDSANTTTTTPAAITHGGLKPPPPQSEAALAGAVQHIGRRNFVGVVVLAVLVFLGLVLWLSFGRWPRAGMRRIWARVPLARGDKRAAKSASGSGPGGAQGDSDEDSAAGRGALDVARVQDEKRGDEDAAAVPRCSPLPAKIEVESLEKDAGDSAPARTGPRHVHFA